LTVKVHGEQSTVQAVLLVDSATATPDEVTFYFPPLSSGDVQLHEETSSLVAALLGFTLSAIGLALAFAMRKR